MNQRAGVVTAVVEEVHAEQGRVRVEYRGMQQSLLSPWAYIAAPMSGRGRGALFMPERGDEVLVCFGDGDFAHPYVVGFLWNGEQTSPETEAHNRVIVTPGGHQLRFEDKEGDRRIVLMVKDGHRLVLDEKAKLVTLKSKEGHKLEFDDNANKVVLTDKNGSNHVTIEMGGTIRVQASSQVTVEAPAIALTDGAPHPLTFGDLLLQYLNTTLLPVIQSHIHQPQFALGIFPVTPAPPVPPFPAATPAIHSTRVKTG